MGFGSIVETGIKWKSIGYTQNLSNILKSKRPQIKVESQKINLKKPNKLQRVFNEPTANPS